MAELIKRKNGESVLILNEKEFWITLSGLILYSNCEPPFITGCPFNIHELSESDEAKKIHDEICCDLSKL